MKSIESQMFSPEQGPTLEEKAEVVIESSWNDRPGMGEFSDVYEEEKLQEDREKIARKKNKIDRENYDPEKRAISKRSEALEVITGYNIEMSDWFGGSAMTARTTEFDDLVNGVDIVVEFEPEEEPQTQEDVQRIALAVDAYSGTNEAILSKKISRHLKIVNGERDKQKVEYFKSQINVGGEHYMGKLEDVVPVVVGVSGKNVDNLITKAYALMRLEERRREVGALDENEKIEMRKLRNFMAEHPAQIWALEEIIIQLEAYMRLAQSPPSGVSEELEGKIAALHGILKTVKEEKEEQFRETHSEDNDRRERIVDKIEEILDRKITERVQ